MIKENNVKVQIKEQLKKRLVFGMQARAPIAIILSFFGYAHETLGMMQTCSHSTRAFICNA